MLSSKWFGLCLSLLVASPFLSSAQASTSGNESSAFEYSVIIKGTAQEVWDAISSFETYDQWNEWTTRVDGQPELGEVVKAYGKDKDGIHLDLKITSFKPLEEICWVDVTWFTHFGMGGWRCRRIEEMPDGESVRFVNHFQYTGVFKAALEYKTRDRLEKGMQLENSSLKAFIESRDGAF